MNESTKKYFSESKRENDILQEHSRKRGRRGFDNFAANPNLYCTPEMQEIEHEHQNESSDEVKTTKINRERSTADNQKSRFTAFIPKSSGKLRDNQEEILGLLQREKSEKVLEEEVFQYSKEKEFSNLAKSGPEAPSSSHNQYSQDIKMLEESYLPQEPDAPEKELSEDEYKSNTNLDFDQFKIIKVKSIYRAYHYIEQQASKTNKNKENRIKAARILREIQHMERTQENFKLYKEVVEYAKNDICINTALEKIQLGKDISKIALNFDQFTMAKVTSISTAYNHIEVAANNSRINKENRIKAARILREIQHMERTQENFKLYKEVVEYAKNDKTILNALDKIKYESNDKSG